MASGDPGATSVVLWAHVTAGNAEVSWSIASVEFDSSEPASVQTGTVAVAASSIGGELQAGAPVSVVVENLAPATDYRYRFETAVGDVAEGTTRTLPARDGSGSSPSSFRLGLASCARWPDDDFDLYRRLAEAKPHLMLHLGDYLYTDGESGARGAHEPPRACRTDLDYERRYRQYRADPDLRSLHEHVPWVAIWDDHEMASGTGPATEAYTQWLPQRPHGNGPTTVDRAIRLGELADLVVVDTRKGERRAPRRLAAGPAAVSEDHGALLSEDQWAWLETQIAESTAAWLLIGTAVQFLPLRLAPVPALRVPPYRWLINPDQWDGYPRERERLLALLARHRSDGVVMLSGDLHARFHSRLSLDSGLVVHEITTPSISARPFALAVRRALPPARLNVPNVALTAWLDKLNPHIQSLDLESHGATVLDITESAIEVRSLIRDADDGHWTIRRR